MKKFMCILTAIVLCGCEDPVQKQLQEDVELVYQREVDLCVCAHVNLPNYTDVLIRAGVDICVSMACLPPPVPCMCVLIPCIG